MNRTAGLGYSKKKLGSWKIPQKQVLEISCLSLYTWGLGASQTVFSNNVNYGEHLLFFKRGLGICYICLLSQDARGSQRPTAKVSHKVLHGYWLNPYRNTRNKLLGELPWLAMNASEHYHTSLLRELHTIHSVPLGEDNWNWKVWPFNWAPSYSPSSFTNFNLYTFT